MTLFGSVKPDSAIRESKRKKIPAIPATFSNYFLHPEVRQNPDSEGLRSMCIQQPRRWGSLREVMSVGYPKRPSWAIKSSAYAGIIVCAANTTSLLYGPPNNFGSVNYGW